MSKQPVVLVGGRKVRCCYCRTDAYGLPELVERPRELVKDPNPGSPMYGQLIPSAVPVYRRLNERHVGIRLGDHPTGRFRWQIKLNGDDVTTKVFEAYAGTRDDDPGWVAMYVKGAFGKPVACTLNRSHALAELIWGDVRIQRVPQ